MSSESTIPRIKTSKPVYAELYNEMRRFRDYELTASNWYTVMLLAIIGFVLNARFGADSGTSVLGQMLSKNIAIKTLLAIATGLIGASALYSIRYVRKRYTKMRDYVTKNLEPQWHCENDVRDKICLQPHHCVMIVQAVLIVAAVFIILYPT